MTEVDQYMDSCLPYENATPDSQPEQLSMETAVDYNLCKTPDDSLGPNSRQIKTTTCDSSRGHRVLPPGWERIKSEKHGRFYYWNRTTDKTTWKFPEEEAKEHKKVIRSHNYVNVEMKPILKPNNSKTSKASPAKSADLKQPSSARSEGDSSLSKSNSHTGVTGTGEANGTETHLRNVPLSTRLTISPGEPQNHVSSKDTVLTTHDHPSVNDDPVSPSKPHPRQRSEHRYVNVELTKSTVPIPSEKSAPSFPDTPTGIDLDMTTTDSPETEQSLSNLQPPPHYEDTVVGSNVPGEVVDEHFSHSPTPPLPIRHYSEDDLHLPPPAANPSSRCEVSPTPPAVLVRRYNSSSDLLKDERNTTTTGDDGVKTNTVGAHSSRPKSNSLAKLSNETHPPAQQQQLKHEVVESSEQYAVVDKTKRKGQEPTCKPSMFENDGFDLPRVPLRARQRMALDTEESGYSSISEYAQEESVHRKYVELDIQMDPNSNIVQGPLRPPVAYSVVELPRERDRPPPLPALSMPLAITKVMSPLRPCPYEIPLPASSVENLVDPGYMQIEDDENKPNDEGYMEVKRVQRQTTPSQEDLQKRKNSSKELYSIPFFPTDQGTGEGREKRSPLPESIPSWMESSFSQDSVFGSSQPDYDLPANSRRLKQLNVTLPRNTPSNVPGYSHLDLSREAILLRSGVTLRRYSRGESVSSILSAYSKPERSFDDGSDGSSVEGGASTDDGLEPVNKAIKSLETTLGVTADNLSNFPDQNVPMARTPVGPPSWTKQKRRLHTYEEVSKSQDDSTSHQLSEIRKKSTDADMDWDESDFGLAKTKSKLASDNSEFRSASQPNLLQDCEVVNLFPHLEKPCRVSVEAFHLRKRRLLNHSYEEVDDCVPNVRSNSGSVGDVNALASAVTESWLESDQTPGDGKLPKDWQKLKDENDRLYYWHVPTGRTQYTRPTGERVKKLSLTVEDSHSIRSTSSPPVDSNGKRKPYPTYSARFLGSLSVNEDELLPGQCVKIVHSCIDKLTAEPETQNSSNKRVVFLQIHNTNLRWLDPETSTPTIVQAINKIRVWGIGLENERDFGYVARNLETNKHSCHVFRCERPARAVARSLLEAHRKEKDERNSRKSKKQDVKSSRDRDSPGRVQKEHSASPDVADQSKEYSHSPSPSNDPSGKGQLQRYEKVTCTYIGSCDVPQAKGMDTVNDAVELLCRDNKKRWLNVNLDIATSYIKISDIKTDTVIREHRVRFLCFLGIAKDDRFCGYILDNGMKNGEKHFQFHGFLKEPNTDKLCLYLHSACQARYKRVLDSNQESKERERVTTTDELPSSERPRAKSNPNLFERIGSLRKSKKPLIEETDESKLQSFVVQYLGCQAVSKPDGLNTVKIPVQQLALPKGQSHLTPAHLVEFEVTPGGLCINNPNKKIFSKKNFAVKNVTYVVRIRNYFAFISRDSGKFMCHVFLENEVDAGTIVSTIEKMLAPGNTK